MKKVTRRDFTKAATATLTSMLFTGNLKGANDKVQLAVIGPGQRGKQLMNECLGGLNGKAEVTAVCDVFWPFLMLAKDICQKSGKTVSAYADFREVLSRPDIDAVVIATPDHWHAYMTIEACKAGKDVYVEKPVSVTIDESRKMVEAAKKYGRVVQSGTQQRSMKVFNDARLIVQSKQVLGEVFNVSTWINGDGLIGAPPDSAPPPGLDWDLWQGPVRRHPFNVNRFGIQLNPDGSPAFNKNGGIRWSSFRVFWEYAGGIATDWGVHLLDTVLWTMDKKGPLAVTANGGLTFDPAQDNRETPNTLFASFNFPGFNCEFKHMAYTLIKDPKKLDGRKRNHGILYEGTDRSLVVDRDGLEILSPWGPPPDEITVEDQGRKITIPLKNYDPKDKGPGHMQNFVDCIRSRKEPASTIESGHLAGIPCHLANIAFRTGTTLAWDHDREKLIDAPKEAEKLLKREYQHPWKLEV